MKKLFALMAVAGFLTACGGTTESETTVEDTIVSHGTETPVVVDTAATTTTDTTTTTTTPTTTTP